MRDDELSKVEASLTNYQLSYLLYVRLSDSRTLAIHHEETDQRYSFKIVAKHVFTLIEKASRVVIAARIAYRHVDPAFRPLALHLIERRIERVSRPIRAVREELALVHPFQAELGERPGQGSGEEQE